MGGVQAWGQIDCGSCVKLCMSRFTAMWQAASYYNMLQNGYNARSVLPACHLPPMKPPGLCNYLR